MIRSLLGLLVTLSVNVALGDSARPSIEVLKTIHEVSTENGLDSNDLIKIAYVESRFKIDAIRSNKNGTVDVGLFQVNSIHWSSTCKGLDVFSVRGNTQCAARLIKMHKKSASHFDTKWLGRYHSKTPSLKTKYVNLLENAPIFTISQK